VAGAADPIDFQLEIAAATGSGYSASARFNGGGEASRDMYELERRLGHRSQRYIARYTNPPEHLAAGFAEDL
jgi:hypothetical protein